MCGLVGAAGFLGINHEKALKDLLFMDTLRGAHSTGLVKVTSTGTVATHKLAVAGPAFVKEGGTTTFLSTPNRVLIGHNRFATQGAINAVNAHPFSHGKIHGAHNGTLTDQTLLPDHAKFVVDSENIIHALNVQDTKKTVESLEGAFALTWFDSDDSTLNFVRNSQRPLHYVYTKGGQLFWASEKWMLLAALTRQKIEYNRVVECKVGTHYQFPINCRATLPTLNAKPTSETCVVFKPRTREYKMLPQAPVYSNNYYDWGSNRRRSNYSNGNVHKKPKAAMPQCLTDLGYTKLDEIKLINLRKNPDSEFSYLADSLYDDFTIAVYGRSTIASKLEVDILGHEDIFGLVAFPHHATNYHLGRGIKAQGLWLTTSTNRLLKQKWDDIEAVPSTPVQGEPEKKCNWCKDTIAKEEEAIPLVGGSLLCPKCVAKSKSIIN